MINGGNTKAENQAIVENVLQQCLKHRLAVMLLKIKFYVKEAIFLSHIINSQEVKMDPSKLQSMFKWLMAIKKKELPAFCVLANYYSQFIACCRAKANRLIDVTNDVYFTCWYIQ